VSKLNSAAKKLKSPIKKTERLKLVWETTVCDYVIKLAWVGGDQQLVVATSSGPVSLFDTITGQLQWTASGHKFGTLAVAVQDTQPQDIVTAGQDGQIRFWDRSTGQQRLALLGGASWVENLAWSPQGDLLASGAGRKLRLWNPQGELVDEYPDHPSTISSIQWCPTTADLAIDSTAMLASAAYGCLQLWLPSQSTPWQCFTWKSSVLKLLWSPNGKFIATGDQDATVHFWMVASQTDLQMWGYPTKVQQLSWDYQSRYLATGGSSEVTIWDCHGAGPENTTPIVLKLHQHLIEQLAYQHQGPVLASAGEDGVLALWQPDRNPNLLARKNLGAPISQLAWAANDTYLAVGTKSGKVMVWQYHAH
jgi:WD40 repeat protein